MRHLMLCLLALVLVAPNLSATESEAANEYVPNVVQAQAVDSDVAAESSLNLSRMVTHESAGADDAAVAQLGDRGGFWWVVGVIVVAGVILAVIV